MKLDIKTLDAKSAGSIDLDDNVFGIKEVRGDILQRMVKYQLAKRRAGTHKTQSRGEVSVSHSKLYKQKGTGQARHGAANAPIFRGGGHAHNRLPRDYSHGLTKQFRALALRHALSAKANAGDLVVIDALSLKDAKTSSLAKSLKSFEAKKPLIVGGATIEDNIARASANLVGVNVLPSVGLNVYDILRADKLVLTKDAVDAIHTRFKGCKPAKTRAQARAGLTKVEAAPKKRAAPKKKTEAEGASA